MPRATASHDTKAAESKAARPDSSRGNDPEQTLTANPLWESLATRVQTKLQVGAPDDVYEREADEVADAVVQRKEACQCGGTCPSCKSADQFQVQRKTRGASSSDGSTAAPPSLTTGLGAGQPLQESTRTFFEAALNHDFSGTRLHTDARAAESAASINARAYTYGRNVVFGQGQFQPDTRDGQRLLAHELAHVVQQSGNGPAKLQRWPGDPDSEEVEIRAKKYLSAKASEAVSYEAYFGDTNITNVEEKMVKAIDAGHNYEPSATEVDEMKIKARSLHTITATIGSETLDLVTAIMYLDAILGLPPELEPEWGRASYGSSYFRYYIADGIANYILSDLYAIVFPSNFVRTVQDWGDPRGALSLELEGSLDFLIYLRDTFSDQGTTQDQRAVIGPQIGEVARRILLLNDALLKLDKEPDLEHTPLDEALDNAQSKIDEIRRDAATEEGTLQALGNEPRLLSTRRIGPNEEFALNPGDPQKITPDMAFPEASTRATEREVSDLASRVRGESQVVQEARKRVIPQHPNYTLQEFIQVYDYWFDFFSIVGREANEQWQSIDQFYRGMHQVAGMADEGAILHLILMDQMAPLLRWYLGDAQSDFSAQIPTLRRAQSVEGTAEEPYYDYAEIFRGTTGSESLSGEQTSRQEVLTSNLRRTYLESKGRDNGWSYLIRTELPSGRQVAERKVLHAEVANYLLARSQQLTTLEQAHTPGFGDERMAAKGVESGLGIGEQTYIKGERNAVNPDVERDQAAIQSEQQQAADYDERFVQGFHRPTDYRSRAAQGVIGELEAYLNAYFQTREEVGFRVAAILYISNKEHNAKALFLHQLDPVEFGKSLLIAFGVHAFQKAISKIASRAVARAIGKGISRVMTLIGGSDISALVFLVKWVYQATEVDNFSSARLSGYFGQFAAEGMGQLLAGAATSVVMKGFGAFAHMRETPQTARELTNDLSFLTRDPEARDIMLHEVRTEIAQAESGLTYGESNPDVIALRAIEADLMGVSRIDAPDPADVRLEHLPDRTPDQELHDVLETFAPDRQRTHAEREALSDALDVLKDQVPILENPTLPGHTVRVRFRNGEVRMEVGPEATAWHVQQHVETVRQLRKYQGPLGTIRRLISRIGSVLGLIPGYGTRGFEATLEVQKLERIHADLVQMRDQIDARAERLTNEPDLAANRAEREAIDKEIDAIQEQLFDHLRDVESYEQGQGYIAAKDVVSAGEAAAKKRGLKGLEPAGHYWRLRSDGKLELVNNSGTPMQKSAYPTRLQRYVASGPQADLTFSSTDWLGAFRELEGHKSTSSFGRFVTMLTSRGIQTQAQIVDGLKLTEGGTARASGPQGLRFRTVRHTYKQRVIENLVMPYLLAPTRRRSGTPESRQAESHKLMLELTKELDSADKGSIAARWYDAVYGKPSGEREIEVTPEQMSSQGVKIAETRRFDRVEGETAFELKNVEGDLSQHSKEEFDDHLKIIGQLVPVRGRTRRTRINKLVWVMLDPNGVKRNASWIRDAIDNRTDVSFQVFNKNGEPTIIDRSNKDVLNEPQLSALLFPTTPSLSP